MKARKLELKDVSITDDILDEKTGSYVSTIQGNFSYRDTVKVILLTSPSQGGASSDEVIKSVMIYGKLKDELRKKTGSLLLDQEDYEYLLARVNNFKWSASHSVVAEFILYIRGLKEVDLVEDSTEQK